MHTNTQTNLGFGNDMATQMEDGHTEYDQTHLVVVRGLIHQEVLTKSINEKSSIERRSYNRQVNRSSQLLCQLLSQY